MWKKATCWQRRMNKALVKMLSATQSGRNLFHQTPCFSFLTTGKLTWLGFLATNPPTNPFKSAQWMLVERKKKKNGKTVKASKKNVELTCSLLMALSLICTILVFTKVLWSSVCFSTFQGFVFSGWGRYEFLKVFRATWSSIRGLLQPITWANTAT